MVRGKIFTLFYLFFFAICSYATPPTALNPVDNSANIPTKCVFRFSHAANENFYDIELDTTSSFNSPLRILKLGTVDFGSYSIGSSVRDTIAELFYDQQYYWRARSRTASDTSVWTNILSFHTVGAPTITFPLNNDIVNPASFFVYTNHNIGNRVYYMDFSDDPSFTYPIYYKQVLDVTTINVVYWQGQNIGIGINPFSNSGTFYMRMKVSNNADTSAWSDVVGFEIYGNIGVPFITNNEIGLYPNPASSICMLKNTAVGDVISVADITGKIIETRTSTGTSEWFDCSNLNEGQYYIKIYRDEKHMGIIKFSVVHWKVILR